MTAPIYRAPVRDRDRDDVPVVAEHGAKAGRMLRRFAGLLDGTLVWALTSDGMFHLGRGHVRSRRPQAAAHP